MESATLSTKNSIVSDEITITVTARPEPDVSIREDLKESLSAEEIKEIEEEAEANVWAWSTIEVKATIRGYTSPIGAHLGCGSYKDGRDFRKGGYFEQMAEEAIREAYGDLQSFGVNDELTQETVEEAFIHSDVFYKEKYGW